MASVGLRELNIGTGEVVERVASTGEPLIVTRYGRPLAAIVPVDPTRGEEAILARLPHAAPREKERN